MRWKTDKDGWELCFAFLPIKVEGYWVWLEHYQAKEEPDGWGETIVYRKLRD